MVASPSSLLPFFFSAPALKSRRTVTTARPPGRLLAALRATPKKDLQTYCTWYSHSRTGGNARTSTGRYKARLPSAALPLVLLPVLVRGDDVVQRLTADMTCLLPPTACQLANPTPNTWSILLPLETFGLPIRGRIAWPLPALALDMAAFCFFAFCFLLVPPLPSAPVSSLPPSAIDWSPNFGVPGELV